MNRFYLRFPLIFLALFTLTATVGFSQVRYVKADATGANDGTTWADAYVSLDSALADVDASEIWIAAGVYKPGGVAPDTLSRFAVTRSLTLYGGFDGTESELSDRDPAANPTILDGDIAGDDIAGDYAANKEDNVLHVVYVDSLIQDPVTLDGLVIRNGHANDFGDLALYFEGGAGVWSYSPVQLVGCEITQNYAGGGAGVLLTGPATANSSIDGCNFFGNASSSQATLYANSTSNITVSNSTFNDNSNNRGVVITLFCNGITFDNCTFDGNENPTGFASVGFIWQTINISFLNCDFTNNSTASASAGTFYFDGREITNLALEANINFQDCLFEGNESPAGLGACVLSFQGSDFNFTNCEFYSNSGTSGGAIYLAGDQIPFADPEMAVFDNCIFEGNTATGFGGGAVYITDMSYTFRDCTFDTNLAPNGAHIFSTGDNKEYLIETSVFESGDADFGGAVNNYGANTLGTITNCDFLENNAGTSGGALINGFEATVIIDSCLFDQNVARFGGAIYNQNDTTDVTITNSDFFANSGEFGGAIYRSSGLTMAIDRCNFEGNVATDNDDGGSGGAILSFDNSATENLGTLSISNSVFDLNFANSQGGAIDLNDTETSIVSSVFSNNSALNGGGGGIINNVSDTVAVTVEVSITNSTFANNLAGLGANLAQFTSGPVTSNTILQNNIFFTELGANYAVEEGAPNMISLGGNLANDSSMDDFLTATKDVTGADPLFINASNNNFRLGFGSPAIDGGIADGAPVLDIEGNPRIGDPDKGAFEYDPDTDTREEVLPNQGQLKVFPNPAGANAQLNVANDWRGELVVQIFDLRGQLVRTTLVEKNTDELQLPLNLLQLAAGNYQLTVSNGEKMLTLPLVRQ